MKDLDLVDAPQRLSVNMSEVCITRPFGSQDVGPKAVITAHVLSLNPDLVLCPLAIGDHTDHRIAQAAVLDAVLPRVAFYEDLPYAARLGRDAPGVRARNLHLELTPLEFCSLGGREWKTDCASFYSSQVDLKTVEEIAGFSERYGEGERFWVTPPALEWLQSIDPR